MPKYLQRLLLFSLLLGAIPVISLGVISYYIAKGDIETKVKEGNMQVLLQTQMRVEQVMKTLELTSIQYVNSALVTSSIGEQLTVDDFPKIRDLSKGLYNLQTVAGISDAYLLSFDKDWIVSFKTFGSLTGSAEAETFRSYAKHQNSLFWVTNAAKPPAAEAQVTEPASEETPVTPHDTTRMVYKIPVVPTTSQPKGLLVVELQNNQISNLLTQNNNLGDSYVLDRKGSNFLSNASADKYGEINAMVMERVTQDPQSSGFFNAYAGKKEFGVTYRQAYNGWMYISVVSIDEITAQSRKIAWITFIVCSIIFIFVGLAAFYGSRRIYSPIKRLFEFTKDIEVEGQSGKDEISSIEQRFRTLFSTEKQLQQQVKGHFVQLKEFFMLKLFTGQVSDAEFARRADIFGFPSEWKHLGVLTLQIDSLHGTRYREHDRELLLFAINNIVGELIPAERRFSPLLHDQSQVTLLISQSENEVGAKQELYEAAESIKQKVYEFLQLPVSLGISRPFAKLGEAVRAHGEGLEALKSRISLGSEIIVHYDDIEAGKKGLEAAVYMQLKMHEDQLVSAMKLGDMGRVNEQFDKYMAAIVAKEVHANDYPVLMIQLISKMMQLVQEQGGQVKPVLGDRATIEHFLKLGTMEDIADWFRTDLFKPVNAFLNRQAESQYIDIAGQMVKLIHERFDQDISLESCAQTLNFHPVYLSRVFKKEIGINFSEYLADYRMNMAKTWLENTTWKISEIAEKLSYTNTTAFIRTFRKIVGTTPGQYREDYKKL
ncbi:helix-turn-helix domain-containing protein [Paenibacillus allorhizosphaerae]|uniref:HTH-type transcriptional regulator YesS n=1 Tax=Paenibacillus allorhizosphaerae TaxID=2849866 RepID=A0ABM8VMB5_9BACL|nr:helix-turn-helix domain-containing protein [Paenibacillus allorhizosphaerae]CAG7649557.1 HTH-type transcriptional regulator YesS [Paenibacillus allorhizosphaerae]